MMNGLARLFLSAVLALLVACGDGDGGAAFDAGDDTLDEGVETVVLDLGSGTGDLFTSGELELGVTSLSAGGQTSVTATIVDSSGVAYTEPVDVTFVSDCSGQGTATLESPISTVGGYATSTYKATGCEGTDTITATASANSQTLTATADITVQPASVHSVVFIAADPSLIGLKGTGLTESSAVSFQLVDSQGNPVAGKQVNFSLDTTSGGITISPESATTDSSGMVQATVNSGTIATTVKVTAEYADDPTIATQSDGLVISTGVGDQDSFSLSAEVLNPEAWNHDGEIVQINIYAADHFNNPVRDGTTVNFTTEGGQIVSSCQTESGGCSVSWTSSNPRPLDGRVTILATMIGEESFDDLNGDGWFNGAETFGDLAEAFRDDDEDGLRDGDEEFKDFNSNSAYDAPDGAYNGVLCGVHDTVPCGTEESLHVREDLVLVMSGSEALIGFSDNPIDASAGIYTGTVTISDFRGQPMPSGTTIDISTTNGSVEGTSSFTVPDTNVDGPLTYNVTVKSDGDPSPGLLEVIVTTPKGLESIGQVVVND
ncbi:Ig-like domain-containing protein [Thiohalomonas denitrificans]|uniref:Ig-like domain-containing protein n=1 Tax=Thiohalomonas denitrificans TaxID=415747 RepID=UPI0026EA97D9|nr:Ig-like domain-containing protein [Thiohalomonas denitrificans]